MTEANTKAAAWDALGGLFWQKGRASARPTAAEIDLFLADLQPGTRCAVVGASTMELVTTAAERGLRVTVFDFSPKMCEDLARVLNDPRIDIVVQDITAPVRPQDYGVYEAVLSDRLINRFTTDEASTGFRGMLQLASLGATVRTSVMLGFYKMDERMIEEGSRRGTLDAFFDAGTRTIDFVRAGPLLEDCLLPHGEIDRDLLIAWYRGRGRESRFTQDDVIRIASSVHISERRLIFLSETPFAHNSTTHFVFQAT